jgi:uncharacterized protein
MTPDRAMRMAYLLLTVATLASCREPQAAPVQSITIRISAGTHGGDFDAIAHAFASTLGLAPGYAAEVQVSAGAVDSIEAVDKGASDCGFSFSNVAYEAFAGRLPDEPKSLNRVRGVALVQVWPLYFLVNRQSSIQGISDLRGRTVAFGVRRSGTFRAAMLVLEAYGIDARGVHVQEQGFRESFAQLATQAVDGVFFLAGQRSDIVSRAAKYARIIPLSGAPVDRLRERYPFFRPSLIPSHTYLGQELPVKTLGLEGLLLCRSDLEARHARQVTKAWFTTLERAGRSGLIANAIGPKAAAATPIPLHPGAAEYYRARQLLPE